MGRGRRLIIEDDYDSEFRYDRVAVGALQGLAPEQFVYIGSASKRLAPAMRLGWMLLPSWLTWELTAAKTIEDCGSEIIGQLACATSSLVASSTAMCAACACAISAAARH